MQAITVADINAARRTGHTPTLDYEGQKAAAKGELEVKTEVK